MIFPSTSTCISILYCYISMYFHCVPSPFPAFGFKKWKRGLGRGSLQLGRQRIRPPDASEKLSLARGSALYFYYGPIFLEFLWFPPRHKLSPTFCAKKGKRIRHTWSTWNRSTRLTVVYSIRIIHPSPLHNQDLKIWHWGACFTRKSKTLGCRKPYLYKISSMTKMWGFVHFLLSVGAPIYRIMDLLRYHVQNGWLLRACQPKFLIL